LALPKKAFFCPGQSKDASPGYLLSGRREPPQNRVPLPGTIMSTQGDILQKNIIILER
jgi:hypothetical protein